MTSASRGRSLGTLIAIARTRVAADKKTGAITPPGIRALAEIVDESTVVITSAAGDVQTLELEYVAGDGVQGCAQMKTHGQANAGKYVTDD